MTTPLATSRRSRRNVAASNDCQTRPVCTLHCTRRSLVHRFALEAFEPFVHDVERARTLPPLTIDHLRKTPLGASLDLLLNERDHHTTALVTFSGVARPDALKTLATSAGPGATLLDLKEASESLVAEQRERMLWSLAVAAVLLIAVVSIALRDVRRVIRVIAPMTLTILVIVAVLQAAGASLTLFHLIALILAAGLGLDYALFFEHAADDPSEQRRTLHAILVCSLSTLMVFALLATSSLPVLRAIGVTVSIGVVSNFVLALLVTRRARDSGLGTRARERHDAFWPEPRAPSPKPSSWPAPCAPRPAPCRSHPAHGRDVPAPTHRRVGRRARRGRIRHAPLALQSAAAGQPAASGAPVRVRRTGDGGSWRAQVAAGARTRLARNARIAACGEVHM